MFQETGLHLNGLTEAVIALEILIADFALLFITLGYALPLAELIAKL